MAWLKDQTELKSGKIQIIIDEIVNRVSSKFFGNKFPQFDSLSPQLGLYSKGKGLPILGLAPIDRKTIAKYKLNRTYANLNEDEGRTLTHFCAAFFDKVIELAEKYELPFNSIVEGFRGDYAFLGSSGYNFYMVLRNQTDNHYLQVKLSLSNICEIIETENLTVCNKTLVNKSRENIVGSGFFIYLAQWNTARPNQTEILASSSDGSTITVTPETKETAKVETKEVIKVNNLEKMLEIIVRNQFEDEGLSTWKFAVGITGIAVTDTSSEPELKLDPDVLLNYALTGSIVINGSKRNPTPRVDAMFKAILNKAISVKVPTSDILKYESTPRIFKSLGLNHSSNVYCLTESVSVESKGTKDSFNLIDLILMMKQGKVTINGTLYDIGCNSSFRDYTIKFVEDDSVDVTKYITKTKEETAKKDAIVWTLSQVQTEINTNPIMVLDKLLNPTPDITSVSGEKVNEAIKSLVSLKALNPNYKLSFNLKLSIGKKPTIELNVKEGDWSKDPSVVDGKNLTLNCLVCFSEDSENVITFILNVLNEKHPRYILDYLNQGVEVEDTSLCYADLHKLDASLSTDNPTNWMIGDSCKLYLAHSFDFLNANPCGTVKELLKAVNKLIKKAKKEGKGISLVTTTSKNTQGFVWLDTSPCDNSLNKISDNLKAVRLKPKGVKESNASSIIRQLKDAL